jgi:transposase
MKKFAGLDVHSKWSAFVVRNESGEEIARGQFDTTADAIAKFVAEQALGAGDVIGMETGSVSFFMARQLQKHSAATVQVIDAREVRNKARSKKKKSDFRDAEDISDGLVRRAYVRLARLPEPWEQQTRDVLAKREHFCSVARGEICSAKSIVRRQGKQHLLRTLTTAKAWQTLTSCSELDEETKDDLKRHFELWQLATKQIQHFDKRLKALSEQRRTQIDRLQTVPGIGPIVSMTVLAYLGEASRFESAKHAASYAGLVPSTYDSVKTGRHGHITREGSPALRRALVLAAQHAGRKTHALHRSFARIMAKKKSRGVAIVATANRLARICYSMLKHERDFDVSRYASKKWEQLERVQTQRPSQA